MAVDYSTTVLLPKTDFPMKADLPKREPGILERWEREKIFTKILENRKDAPNFALHDGPPYANGHIHQGHTLNKILKDMVVKYRTMAGFKVDYVPGWDCHGLPIETALEKDMGRDEKAKMSKVAFRQACRDYATRFIDIQRNEFKRLGVFGRWEDPYLTMAPGYEAIIAREFGRFVGNGGAYKGKKPVHWCWNDQTALAEAEVEYPEEKREDPSIWVKFALPESEGGFQGKKTSVIIWTTTPWTLPANLGISLNPQFEYVAIEPASHPGEAWIVAKGLLAKFLEETKTPPESMLLGPVDPKKLEGKNARHPFLDRASKILLGDHVTLEAGTGCVHTAPGHGYDDFMIGNRYGLEVLVPVNDGGVLTEEAGPFAGQFVFKANPLIIERLRADGNLVHDTKLKHDYPHCWRCKKPTIQRATTQWFISMEKNALRKNALTEIDRVQWIPAWGRERIHGMVANRPDWCISRQRTWGVPIVAFKCGGCLESHTSQAIVDRVAHRFESEGADAWYARSAQDLIGDEKCPTCGKSEWAKEEDILDVWFESGVSFAAVCETRPKSLGFPVDLYLEGSDQHRGWFHSTLLAAVGTRNRNAYKACLTHGFVVGADGKKLSKSAKNYVSFEQVIAQSGAELLRLWVAASEFREDIRLSTEIMKRVEESYRDIRNKLARFALGNLHDFDPERDRVAVKDLGDLDRLMLHRLATLVDTLKGAYEGYEFHVIYHSVVNFVSDLSSLYADAVKDRLYTERATSKARRAAQTVLFEALAAITRALAPVLAFTTEEIWGYLPAWKGKESSVHLARFPEVPKEWRDVELEARWAKLLVVRDVVLKRLEELRTSQQPLQKVRKSLGAEDAKRIAELEAILVGKPGDARATIAAASTGDVSKSFLEQNRAALRESIGVSALEITGDESAAKEPAGVKVTVDHAPGSKCPRCWIWYPTLAGDTCARCKEALAA